MIDEKKTSPLRWWVLGVLVGLIVLGIARWLTLSEPKYFLPQTAGDWAAWGAVVGSGGTIGAVIYAARTFKSSSDAQLAASNAQLSAEADRRKEMDHLEDLEAEEIKKLKLVVLGIELNSRGDLSGVEVLVKNYSEQSHRDLQVFIPGKSLIEGNSIVNPRYYRGFFKNADGLLFPLSNFVQNRQIQWREFEPVLTPNAEMTHFPIGDLAGGQALKLVVDFEGLTYEHEIDWSLEPQHSEFSFQRKSLVSISFVDQRKKHWMRSTHDEGRPRRLRYPRFE